MNKDIYFIRVCEIAAINAYSVIGCKNKNLVDKIAVDSMRYALNECPVSMIIKSGEGYLDNAPQLFIGEKLGMETKSLSYDVAVDPIENTEAAAYNGRHAVVCLAYNYINTIKTIPETYMEKLFVHKKYLKDIDESLTMIDNVLKISKLNENIKIIMLDKPRHKDTIKLFRDKGIEINLIQNGDVVGAIAVTEGSYDLVYGIGGSVEGVLMSALSLATGCYLKMKFVQYNTIWKCDNKEDQDFYQEELIEMKKYNLEYGKNYYDKDFIISNSVRFIATFLTPTFNHEKIIKDKNIFELETFLASHGIVRTIKSTYDLSIIKSMLPKLYNWINKN